MSLSERCKKLLYPWGDSQKSISEILHDPCVQKFVGEKTYASKRELPQKLLRGKINPELVKNSF